MTGEEDIGAGGASHTHPNQHPLYANSTLTPDQRRFNLDGTYSTNQRHLDSNTDYGTTTNEQCLHPDRTSTTCFVGLDVIRTHLRRGGYSDASPSPGGMLA